MSFSKRALSIIASESALLPPIQIEDFKAIDKENYNIVFSTTNSNKIRSFDDYHKSLASLTDNKLGIVEGSLFKINDNRAKPHMRCIASANREVIEYKGDNTLKDYKLRPLHANVLEDSNGHIWRIVSNGEEKRIVQVSEDDYTNLLAQRRKFAQMTASDSDFSIPYEDADYVYFFNPTMEAMDFGFAVVTNKDTWVVSKNSRTALKVKPSQIMEACATSDKGFNLKLKRRELLASSSNVAKDYIDYLASVWGKNSEYVRMWTQMILNNSEMVN